MKKLIFTALSVVAVGSAFAQQKIDNRNETRFNAANKVVSPSQQQSMSKADNRSDWFAPTDWAEASGAGAFMQTYVQFVMPDSLCKYIDEGDTISRPYNISFGQIIDPKDDNIDNSADPGIKMSKWTGYTLDSVGLVYLYVRNVDMKDDGNGNMVDVVDTLIINYFTMPNNGINKNTLVGSGELVAYPNWNVAGLRAVNYIATQKIPLTREDSTTARNNNGGFENAWGLKSKNFAAPAGVTVAAKGATDNIVGYSVGFKLGHAYDSNNVIIYQKDPNLFPLTAPRANYFGYSLAINEGTTEQQVNQTKFYTNALFATKTAAYNNTGSGWSGYIPGNAYFETQYVQADVFLTTLNTGIKTINNDQFAMSSVYPNPAQVGGTAIMAFNLKASSNVSVNIYNIAGVQVKSVMNKTFAAGEHTQEFDLAGLKAGIYLVSMNVNGTTITKKLTITE